VAISGRLVSVTLHSEGSGNRQTLVPRARLRLTAGLRSRHPPPVGSTATTFATEDTKITKDGNGNGENIVTATANGENTERFLTSHHTDSYDLQALALAVSVPLP